MNQIETLDELKNIRQLMERSTRYLTLSGFSSILAGTFALLGATSAYFYLYSNNMIWDLKFRPLGKYSIDPRIILVSIAFIVFMLAFGSGVFFTKRKASKTGMSLWNAQAKRTFIQFAIPLFTGAVFCLLLIWHNNIAMVASASLVFYGLALLNAAKYTFNETHQFAIAQIVLGILAGIFLCYGIFFWAMGFGVFHIIFGLVIHHRYEKK